MKFPINYQDKSFTLIEVLLSLAIIALISTFIFSLFQNVNRILASARINLQIISALQDEIEKIKVLKYEDVGIQGSWPPGILPKEKIIEKGGLQIKVTFYIRNIDDPKDGTITSTPRDTAPADYKLVELEGECLNCSLPIKKQVLTTYIAPKTVEALTRNGSMFIQVINAEGKPVANASVKVDYLNSPQFTIQDITDNLGILRLIDIPPGINAYSIYVTKSGYSFDRTYQPGTQETPNPILPHQTVRAGELTTVTLQIDLLSKLKIKTHNIFCQPLSFAQFNLKGTKLINFDPPKSKTDITTTTDENGFKELNVEFDNYYLTITDSRYVLRSSQPFLEEPFEVKPNSNYFYDLTLSSRSPINLLVSVVDEAGNYLNGANVRVTKNVNEYWEKTTGEETIVNNTWNNSYDSLSLGIDPDSNPEILKLKDLGGFYSTSTEWLVSKTIDLGTSTTAFKKFSWVGNKPPGTSIKFQVSANNDNLTWNFIGPDGTSNSYFEDSEFNLPSTLNNNRYFRYKVYLQTNDPSVTPSLDKISLSFYSSCFSSGEVLFENLPPGEYNLEVTKPGYFFYNKTIILSDEEFYHEKVILTP